MRFGIAALNRGIEELLACDFEITDKSQILPLPGIGKGIAARVDEILKTGNLKELADYKPDMSKTDLHDVFGLGPSGVRRLAEKGITTVASLRTAIASGLVDVPDAVICGVTYYRDLKLRIPRAEMQRYNRILGNIRRKLGPDVSLDLCGSFRRGLPDCGDLDVLVTSETDNLDRVETLMKVFLHELQARKLLVGYLGEGQTKFMGIVMHPQIGIARRIDVRWVPHSSYATALMYFTGSKDFNVMMRRRAIKMGFKLSEYSLEQDQTRLRIHSEQDIFDALQMPFVPPEKR